MATKRVPRARISVSTPELAIIFRGESVSGHPGARGGPKKSENLTENYPNNENFHKIILNNSSLVQLHSGALDYNPCEPREDAVMPPPLTEGSPRDRMP